MTDHGRRIVHPRRVHAMTPTADIIANAIVSAARITGADPEAVARGEIDNKRGYPADRTYAIARARVYAVMALYRVFPLSRRVYLAQACGVGKAGAPGFIASNEQHMRSTRWWDGEKFARVVAAVRAASPDDSASHYFDEPIKMVDPSPRATTVTAPDEDDLRAGESLGLTPRDPIAIIPRPSSKPRKIAATPAGIVDLTDGDERPVMDRARQWDRRETAEDRRARERSECRDLLAEAAANTAKLRTPGD